MSIEVCNESGVTVDESLVRFGRAFTERDRSAIYGGFHLYIFEG